MNESGCFVQRPGETWAVTLQLIGEINIGYFVTELLALYMYHVLKLNGFCVGNDVTFILKYALPDTVFLNRNRLIKKDCLLLSEY